MTIELEMIGGFGVARARGAATVGDMTVAVEVTFPPGAPATPGEAADRVLGLLHGAGRAR